MVFLLTGLEPLFLLTSQNILVLNRNAKKRQNFVGYLDNRIIPTYGIRTNANVRVLERYELVRAIRARRASGGRFRATRFRREERGAREHDARGLGRARSSRRAGNEAVDIASAETGLRRTYPGTSVLRSGRMSLAPAVFKAEHS
ncbi:hypothetical protein FB451DRAFT_1178839 [Mycena latifolia]|nr:hypothetical protein FB451DRAFT_1178839 [Mycena latifolia]